MIKFKTKQGFTIYKSTFFECISATGGLGICDWCNKSNSTLYIIPILNSAMCPECYKDWIEKNPKYFEEDRSFEEAYIRHFEKMAKENNVPIEEKEQSEEINKNICRNNSRNERV